MAGRWRDVQTAAGVLGISTDAVRKRLARGSLASEVRDGRRLVWLDDSGTRGGTPGATEAGQPDLAELVEELRERIASLERQLAQAHEHLRLQLEEASARDRENRRIIAALTQRLPELERAPERAAESPTAGAEESGRDTPTPPHARHERSAQSLSVRLRRWIRGE